MKTILITGSAGFIGKNLVESLRALPQFEILTLHHTDHPKKLKAYLHKSDFIFHLAGVNRPESEKEFQTGNTEYTKLIIDNLEKLHKVTPIVMSSSIQAGTENPYGKSKKEAENIIIKYGLKSHANTYIYRLPNIFGKWSRPNYNSVVATFCHNISRNTEINITDKNKNVKLVYIDDVVREFIKLLDDKTTNNHQLISNINPYFKISLGDLASKIYQIKAIRETATIPNLSNKFTKYLYTTYLSFLDTNDFSHSLGVRKDDRGILFELLKSRQFGQIFVSKTKSGITRGNHFHHTKIEKFCVIRGQATIKFRDIINNNILSYKVSDNNIQIIDIPPGYTHSITNTSNKELITLFWANEIFNPKNPDTYPSNVEIKQ